MTEKTIFAWLALVIMGCVHFDKTNTPVGSKTDTMIGAGLVSVSTTDTKESFEEDCPRWLMAGHDGETNMIRRDIYQTCFSNHMLPIDPMGQRPAPMPIDTNGDGRPDSVQFSTGLRIPQQWYTAYPGWWPGVFNAYGVQQGMTGAMFMAPGMASPVGGTVYAGSLDPTAAYMYYAATRQRSAPVAPPAPKAETPAPPKAEPECKDCVKKQTAAEMLRLMKAQQEALEELQRQKAKGEK